MNKRIILFLATVAAVGTCYFFYFHNSEVSSEQQISQNQSVLQNKQPVSNPTNQSIQESEHKFQKSTEKFSSADAKISQPENLNLPDLNVKPVTQSADFPQVFTQSDNFEPVTSSKNQPKISIAESDVLYNLEHDIDPAPQEILHSQDSPRAIRQGALLIKSHQPELESGLDFKGKVKVLAKIGTNGKVKAAEIKESSGRLIVDNIAKNSAMQYEFKPALDYENKPIESEKAIEIEFK